MINSNPLESKLDPKRVHNPLKYISGLVDTFARATEVSSHPLVTKLIGNLRSRSFGLAVTTADSIGSQVYTDAAEHFAMNQLALLVKKVPFEDPSLSPETTAWKKFLAAEHSCKRVNQRLRAEKGREERRHSRIRFLAQEWIADVIGLTPNLTDIYKHCDFGPGASVGIHGESTHKAAKLCSLEWSCTPLASDYARSSMVGDHHIWEFLQNRDIPCLDIEDFIPHFDKRLVYRTANKIIMVPKTAKVHRTIAIEPLLNGYVQKGVDEVLRKKLRHVGLDLRNQELNQQLAKTGSEGGFNPFVTIDLSAASDSLSIETVSDLIPRDWFLLLSALRSPNYESEWGDGRYEKFSSMGNGFCFPLETLIFASLAYAVGEVTGDPVFRVYGDDIIVHQRAALLLIEILKFYGFSTNTDKTFLFGPFRESCGADYFEGVNVRPYSLDFIPSTDRDIYKIANGVRSSAFFSSQEVWEYIVRPIPVRERFYRPISGPPDTALDVTHDVFMSGAHAKWNKDIQNWTWKEYVTRAVVDERRPPPSVQMYGLLRGQRSNRWGNPEFTFRRKTRTAVRKVPDCPPTARC